MSIQGPHSILEHPCEELEDLLEKNERKRKGGNALPMGLGERRELRRKGGGGACVCLGGRWVWVAGALGGWAWDGGRWGIDEGSVLGECRASVG